MAGIEYAADGSVRVGTHEKHYLLWVDDDGIRLGNDVQVADDGATVTLTSPHVPSTLGCPPEGRFILEDLGFTVPSAAVVRRLNALPPGTSVSLTDLADLAV